VTLAGHSLVACVDTGATFSLLSSRVYHRLRDQLPPLRGSDIILTGAGGESLEVEGLLQAEVELGGQKYEQEMQVGRLEELDLLLGMDWLATYRVEINCGRYNSAA